MSFIFKNTSIHILVCVMYVQIKRSEKTCKSNINSYLARGQNFPFYCKCISSKKVITLEFLNFTNICKSVKKIHKFLSH